MRGRIEACCGKMAEEYVSKEEAKLNEAAELVKTQPAKLCERISQLLEETALLKEQLKTFKGQQLKTVNLF